MRRQLIINGVAVPDRASVTVAPEPALAFYLSVPALGHRFESPPFETIDDANDAAKVVTETLRLQCFVEAREP